MDTPALPSSHIANLPEVLDEIVKYLGRGSLSRTACVSVSFHYASIQRLWSGLDLSCEGNVIDRKACILVCLGQLLPPDLTSGHHPDTEPSFTRPTTPSDWIRFKHYSAHVKATVIRHEGYWLDLFAALDTQMFPRLQKIYVTWACAREYPRLEWIVLVGAPLRSFGVIFWGSNGDEIDCIQAFDTILKEVANRSPYLRDILCEDMVSQGSDRPMPDNVGASLGGTVGLLIHLERFYWNLSTMHVPPDLLRILSTLPHLSQLSMRNAIPPSGCNQNTNNYFSALKSLRIVGSAEETNAWFASFDNSSLLAQLSIGSYPNHPPSFQIPNLTALHLTLDPKAEWDDLRPLLSSKSIAHACLFSDAKVNGLNDSALRMLALAWRNLEDFTLMVHPSVEITFLGLASFASSCRLLRQLRITINSRARLDVFYGEPWQGEYQRILGGSYPSSPLESLHITTILPRETSETTPTGLGLLGLGHIIHKLWPLLNPDEIFQRECHYESYGEWKPMSAIVKCIKLYEAKMRELCQLLEHKERELEELRKEHDRS